MVGPPRGRLLAARRLVPLLALSNMVRAPPTVYKRSPKLGSTPPIVGSMRFAAGAYGDTFVASRLAPWDRRGDLKGGQAAARVRWPCATSERPSSVRLA